MVGGGWWWLVVVGGGWWLVVGGWWLVVGVCRFKTLLGVPAQRPCHIRHGVLTAHTDTFGIYTRRRFESTHEGVLNLHTHTDTPTHTRHTQHTTPTNSRIHRLKSITNATHNTQHTHPDGQTDRDGRTPTGAHMYRQTDNGTTSEVVCVIVREGVSS